MMSDRYSTEGRDDNAGIFTGMFSNMVGMVEGQVEKVIPEDVAEFFGSTVGKNAKRVDANRTTDFRKQGKIYRKDATHNHRGQRVQSKSKTKHSSRTKARNMYVLPLNDSADWGPSNPIKSRGKEGPPSIAFTESSQSTRVSDLNTNSSTHESGNAWQEEYSRFREGWRDSREDVDTADPTVDEYPQDVRQQGIFPRQPHQPNMVDSLLSSWSTDKGLSVASSQSKVVDSNAVNKGVDVAKLQEEQQVKPQSSMIDSLWSWNADEEEDKRHKNGEKTSSRESLMTELKSKLHGFLAERKTPIDQLLSSRKVEGREVEERCLSIGNLAPPCMYSLSHVRSATAAPATQEDFMSEVKQFHQSHSLRKVPDEDKGVTSKNRLVPTKTIEKETTTLTFVPPKVAKKKKPKKAKEIPETVSIEHERGRSNKKATRKLRKHSPQRKQKVGRRWRLGKITSIFKCKSTAMKAPLGEDVLKNRSLNASSTSIAGSRSSNAYSISVKDSAPAPLSLVEQRKAQLEEFLTAYTQRIQKDTSPQKADPPVRQSTVKSFGETLSGQNSEMSPASVSECTPSTTNSSRSVDFGSGSRCKESKAQVSSKEESGITSKVTSSTGAIMHPSSRKEIRSRGLVLEGVKEQIEKSAASRDALSTTSSLSLPTALSAVQPSSDSNRSGKIATRLISSLTEADGEFEDKALSVESTAELPKNAPTKGSSHGKKHDEPAEILLLTKPKAKSLKSKDKSKKPTSSQKKANGALASSDKGPKQSKAARSRTVTGKRSHHYSKNPTSSRRHQQATSLFGNNSNTYALSDAERRRKERKAALSATLF